DEIPETDLTGGDQVGHREYQVTFDGALQVSGAVARIGAFVQQEVFYLLRARKDELVGGGGHQDSLLHHAELDFQYLFQMLRTQGLEDHDLVNAVHELGGELTARGLGGGAVNFVIQAFIDHLGLRGKSKTTLDEGAHLACPQA